MKAVEAIELAKEIMLGLFFAEPEKSKLYGGYTGFGGIPGFITLSLVPTEMTIARITALVVPS